MDKIDRKPKIKIKIKPFLIGKELKTKDLLTYRGGTGKGDSNKTQARNPRSR